MNLSILVLKLVSILLCSGLIHAATTAPSSSNIQDSCHDFSVSDDHILRASCKRHDDNLVDAEIDLNRCLVNNIAFLSFQQGGHFAVDKSCIGCGLEPKGYDLPFLMCSCVDYRSGIRHTTGVDLSSGIINDDGSLSCFGVKELS